MTKASDVAARLGRSLAPTTPPADVFEHVPAATPSRPPAQATERFTVDLTSDLNDALGHWAQQAKRRVGRRVPKTEVARVLVELLLEDASVAAQVDNRLTRNGVR